MWNLDRRVAAVAGISAALALAIPLAVADGPSPTRPGDTPAALARELAGLANRGAAATWLVTFAFTRTTATGQTLHDTLLSAHVAPRSGAALDLDQSVGALVVSTPTRSYTCTVVADKPQCLARPRSAASTRPGDVYGGAVVAGRYDISRAKVATIAGLESHCFRLQLRSGNPVGGLGFSSEQCYSSEGVPLRSRVQTSAAVDEREALTVRRAVGRGELETLLGPYGLTRLAPE